MTKGIGIICHEIACPEMSEAWQMYKAGLGQSNNKHYLHRPSIIDAVNEANLFDDNGHENNTIGQKWVDVDNSELGHVPGHEF